MVIELQSPKRFACRVRWVKTLMTAILLSAALIQAADSAAQIPVEYDPTEASLKQAEVPEWFIDGKLGMCGPPQSQAPLFPLAPASVLRQAGDGIAKQ
jgi:hypothetical protein